MARRIIASAGGLILAAVLLTAVLVTSRLRSEQSAAQAEASLLEVRIAQLEGQLGAVAQTMDALQGQVESMSQLAEGLRAQVEWDKSHLLDCWTAIVRILPVKSMPGAVRGDVSSARPGRSLDHYVYKCATDAVP